MSEQEQIEQLRMALAEAVAAIKGNGKTSQIGRSRVYTPQITTRRVEQWVDVLKATDR